MLKKLSDAELLASLIYNNVTLAKTSLEYFGGLRNLFDASIEQICNFAGFDKTTHTKLQAILEISQRYLKEQLAQTDIISNTKIASIYLTAKLQNYKHEVFACLFLNNQNQVIHYEELFHGTINHITIYPRKIVKAALHHNAAAVIFAHNHPSGIAIPSAQDKKLTANLTKILRPLDIKVLDHIVVGGNNCVSLKDF